MTKTKRSAERPQDGVRRLAGRVLSMLALGLLALGGCGDLQTVTAFAPETDGAKLFGSLTLDHRAINLTTAAPYDTIRLSATPRSLRGEPLEGLPAPTFRSADTVSVWVTPDGLVKARKATAGVPVIAEVVTGDNVRHVDTAFVKVTANATPPELASLEITFASPEQAELPISTSLFISTFAKFYLATLARQPSIIERAVSVAVLDDAGKPVPGLEIDYVSLDPRNVVVDRRTGAIKQVIGPPGEVSIIARTTAYGVVRADTATFTVTGPVVNGYLPASASGGDKPLVFANKEVVIRPGGYVYWLYDPPEGASSISLVFEDPTTVGAAQELCTALGGLQPHFCESGDITSLGSSGLYQNIRFRKFPEPGVYEFKSPEVGFQGRVRVAEVDDPIWDAMRRGR